jgi:hypothetical protein
MLRSAVEVTLEHNERISDEQRPMLGQSVPIGDAGSGQTGVPAGERGIPQRPGRHALDMVADAGEEELLEDEEALEDDEDEEEDADGEDLDEDDEGEDDGDDDDDDALEDGEDETTDPRAEPGKPV